MGLDTVLEDTLPWPQAELVVPVHTSISSLQEELEVDKGRRSGGWQEKMHLGLEDTPWDAEQHV